MSWARAALMRLRDEQKAREELKEIINSPLALKNVAVPLRLGVCGASGHLGRHVEEDMATLGCWSASDRGVLKGISHLSHHLVVLSSDFSGHSLSILQPGNSTSASTAGWTLAMLEIVGLAKA